MISEWCVLSNNQAIGPYTQAQLKDLMHQGSITATTYVRRLDGPWVTAAQFYSAMASQNVVPQTATAQQPVYSSPVSPAAIPYRRKRASTAVNVVVFISMVLIGGAAAVFTAKSVLSLVQRPAPVEPEVEVIVIPAPSRPAGSAPKPNVVVLNRSGPKVQEPRTAMPAPRIAGNAVPTVNPVPKPASPVTKMDTLAKAWLDKAEDILERREDVRTANNDVVRKLQPSLDEVRRIETELNGIRSQEKRAQAEREERDRNLAATMERRSLTNNATLDLQIAALENEMQSTGSARRDLDRRAESLRERKEELTRSMSPLIERQKLLGIQADRLRTDFVFHTHPFVIQDPSIIDVASSFFAELKRRSNELDRGWGQFGLSCAYLSRNDEDRADSEISQAIDTLPQEAAFRAIRGSRRARKGRGTDAVADAAKAFELDAENWTVNYFAALAYMRRGTIPNLQLAETRLRACRVLDSANPLATIALSILNSASIEERIRKPSYALQLANEAYEIEPSHSSRFALALAQAAHGEFELAIRHTRQALHDADAQSRSWYEECLQRLEDQKPVRIDWREFDLWQYSY